MFVVCQSSACYVTSWPCSIDIKSRGEIFDACCISMTRISALKKMTVVVRTIILFGSNCNIFLEKIYVSLRYDKHRKFDLKDDNLKEESSLRKHFYWWTDKGVQINYFDSPGRKGATTFSIMTFSIMTLSINSLFMTRSIYDTYHNNTVIILSVELLSVTLYLLSYWISVCWMSICWVSWSLILDVEWTNL